MVGEVVIQISAGRGFCSGRLSVIIWVFVLRHTSVDRIRQRHRLQQRILLMLAHATESQQTWETPGRTDGLFPDSLSGVHHYGQICSYKGNGNQQLEPGLEVGTLTCGRFNAKCTALRPREEQICFWGQILALATCVWV
ncbi:hypothetical protein TWF788_006632 [Orbilia oligospora]|uniref:Uncharacterized protein n=1 Tax=Orbilia oligospora TaxID=2813651 RepID=A0A7C8PVM9_ORBOL|nr:hypothetical protein TWF788_006632 [Orbilia oligospora]